MIAQVTENFDCSPWDKAGDGTLSPTQLGMGMGTPGVGVLRLSP